MAGTGPYGGGKPNFLEFITPIGLIKSLYHDVPQLKTDYNTKQPVFDKDGVQEAHYKVTILWPKRYGEIDMDPSIPGGYGLVPIRRLAAQAANEAWPDRLNPDPNISGWIKLQPFLLDGDNPEHNTERNETFFNHYWLNIKQRAKYTKDEQGRVTYYGAPGLLGPFGEQGPKLNPTDIWPGCTGRASGILYGTEFAGKKFVSVRLNNIQLYEAGERLGGASRPEAGKQFDALKPLPAGAIGSIGGGGAGGQPGGFGGLPSIL